MAIIAAGTKVYLNTDVAKPLTSGGEPTNQNDSIKGFENVQDYYGDLAQPQKDVLFQPASILGTTTDKRQVYNGVLYYNVLVKGVVDKRTSHGWNAGTYEKVDWLCWVSSADITDSEEVALEKYNKRTDAAPLETIKNANANGQTNVVQTPKVENKTPVTTPTTTNKGLFGLSGSGTSKTPYFIGGGVLLLALGGLYVYVKNQRKKEALAIASQQQTA